MAVAMPVAKRGAALPSKPQPRGAAETADAVNEAREALSGTTTTAVTSKIDRK